MRKFWILAAVAASGQDVVPVVENPVRVKFDTGYRFVPDIRGDANTYRSIVNLGQGPKLFASDVAVTGWKNRLFDRLDLSAEGWGGEPYTSLRVDFGRAGLYRVHGDYRNAAYFNFLPSFALDQRGFDIRRRMSNVEVQALPGRRFNPYVNYARDAGSGGGVTPFVANGNEYPVATTISDSTHHIRTGARLDLGKLHLTLEQGASVFRDGQRAAAAGRQTGNRATALLGRTLLLDALDQIYSVRGGNVFSQGILAAAPASWIQVNAQFIYARPKSNVSYTERARGLFYLGGTRFADGIESLLIAESKLPRTAGTGSIELRPHGKVRVTQSFMTDRFHTSSIQRLTVNYHREQTEVFVDPVPGVTLRGGHRLIWGDTKQHVALAGAGFRAGTRFGANADYERSPGERSYFRTSCTTTTKCGRACVDRSERLCPPRASTRCSTTGIQA